MPNNSIAEQVFGYLGALCWSIQLVPQIHKSYKSKSTEGLSHWFITLWGLAAPCLGVYVIVQNLNVPLILQPQLFCCLTLISWGQCQYYGNKHSRFASITMTLSAMAILGGLEAGMVFAIKPSYHNGAGNKHGVQFFGILSSILLAIALFPQYYQIYKHGEVIGISTVFMTVDLMGGVFSDLSLVFKSDPDIIAIISYSLVVVLDGIVLICAFILNPRAKRRHRQAARLPSQGTITPMGETSLST